MVRTFILAVCLFGMTLALPNYENKERNTEKETFPLNVLRNEATKKELITALKDLLQAKNKKQNKSDKRDDVGEIDVNGSGNGDVGSDSGGDKKDDKTESEGKDNGGEEGGDTTGSEGKNNGGEEGGDTTESEGKNNGGEEGGDKTESEGKNNGGEEGGDKTESDGKNNGGEEGGDTTGSDGKNNGGEEGGDTTESEGKNNGGEEGGDITGSEGKNNGGEEGGDTTGSEGKNNGGEEENNNGGGEENITGIWGNCGYGIFQCQNGMCVNVDEICNGFPSCSKGEDELFCSAYFGMLYNYKKKAPKRSAGVKIDDKTLRAKVYKEVTDRFAKAAVGKSKLRKLVLDRKGGQKGGNIKDLLLRKINERQNKKKNVAKNK